MMRRGGVALRTGASKSSWLLHPLWGASPSGLMMRDVGPHRKAAHEVMGRGFRWTIAKKVCGELGMLRQ